MNQWKPVKGYEGLYEVSSEGEIKSLEKTRKNSKGQYIQKEKMLAQSLTSTGYKKVELVRNGKKKSLKVHRLVAEAFIPKVEGKPYVNHKDGNQLNNSVDNLEWCTQAENVQHAYDMGLNGNKLDINWSEVAKQYELGISSGKLAKKYNCSVTTITRNLRNLGIEVRATGESQNKYHLEEIDILKELETKTQKELAKELGCDPSLISKYLKKTGGRCNVK